VPTHGANSLSPPKASSFQAIYAVSDDITELKAADITIFDQPSPQVDETIFHEIPGLVHDYSGLTNSPGNHPKTTIIVSYVDIIEPQCLILLRHFSSLPEQYPIRKQESESNQHADANDLEYAHQNQYRIRKINGQ